MKRKIFTLLACAMIAGFASAKTITIDKAAAVPTIDGTLEANVWGAVASNAADQLNGETTDFSASFKMCYDDNNLYVAVSVTDPNPNVIAGNTWQSDCVELFLAMDTANAAAYRPGDWQIRKVAGTTQEDGGVDGSSQVATAEGIKVEQVDDATYVQEWILPWATLIEDAAFDSVNFRFDLQAAQAADATAGRIGQAFWNSKADDQWNSVKNQGFVVLKTKLGGGVSVASKSASKAFAYVKGSILKVKGVHGTVNVIDLTGKIVAKSTVNGEANIDISALKSGMYIVSGNGLSAKIVK